MFTSLGGEKPLLIVQRMSLVQLKTSNVNYPSPTGMKRVKNVLIQEARAQK